MRSSVLAALVAFTVLRMPPPLLWIWIYVAPLARSRYSSMREPAKTGWVWASTSPGSTTPFGASILPSSGHSKTSSMSAGVPVSTIRAPFTAMAPGARSPTSFISFPLLSIPPGRHVSICPAVTMRSTFCFMTAPSVCIYRSRRCDSRIWSALKPSSCR